MATVTFDNVTKKYGDVLAVNDLNLAINDGEFMVLVGPSGCGKTTSLRMIAGLEEITAGELKIGDRVVNDVPPKDRDIAMVFQSYALYPHMTVRDNMAFGLKLRKLPKADIERRVNEAAATLSLEKLLDRKPKELSGGQRQRVALGRALVRDPQVFLMDEPLSNLDAQLRTQTRGEIKRLQREVGTTTVYVTHDQVEAMTMGDRIAIMRDGVLEQVGDPDTVYGHPANTFVAGFIGSPAMSLTPAGAERRDGRARLAFGDLRLDLDGAPDLPSEVVVGVRPEHARLWDDDAGLVGPIDGRVEYTESLGRETVVGVTGPGDARFIVTIDGLVQAEPGSSLRFGLRLGWLYVFDASDQRALGRV